jgi:hypothetical protein
MPLLQRNVLAGDLRMFKIYHHLDRHVSTTNLRSLLVRTKLTLQTAEVFSKRKPIA